MKNIAAIAPIIFAPSREEIKVETEMIELLEGVRKSGRNYYGAIVNGELIASSRKKRARNVLARASRIEERER